MSDIKITVRDAKDVPAKLAQIFDLVSRGIKGGAVMVTLGRETRTPAQNRRLWAVLRDVSAQVDWYGQKLCEEDWKQVFSSALDRQRVVPAIERELEQARFVVLGVSTRGKSKAWFADLFELINAFGADHGVKWSDPALEAFDYYREAQS